MGIGPGQLGAYLEWVERGWLKPGAAILDIGAQQIAATERVDAVNAFISRLGGRPYRPWLVKRNINGEFAGDVFTRAGFRYASIDYKDYPYAIRLDLNVQALPREHMGRFDLVANHGTSEHILNQYNVFKVIHEAAAQNALMFHCVPMSGEPEHGIINYNPKFFYALAAANGYETLGMWSSPEEAARPVDQFADIIFTRPLSAQNAWLNVLFRKIDMRPYAGLIDPAFR